MGPVTLETFVIVGVVANAHRKQVVVVSVIVQTGKAALAARQRANTTLVVPYTVIFGVRRRLQRIASEIWAHNATTY